jgi:signal transduction histidine kinase
VLRVAVGVLGLGLGVGATVVSHRHPAASFSGGTVLDSAVELAAGWCVLATGLVFWRRRPGLAFGPLVACAGVAWFVPELGNPGSPSALLFTLGLAGVAVVAPLVGHAAIAAPPNRVRKSERWIAGIAYLGGIGVLGVVATATFDPVAQGCVECPRNLLLVDGGTGAYAAVERWGLRLGIAWTLLLVAAAAVRLARGPWRNALVIVPTVVYVTAQGLAFLRSRRGNEISDVRLWRAQAIALLLLAAGVAWSLHRSARARAAASRLVLDVRRSFEAGGARAMLAQALGDESLQLVFPVADAERTPGADRARTPLLRDGHEVATLVHDPRLLRDPSLVEDVVKATTLAVEHERFQTQVSKQLEEVRASRARIVEAGDAERRRLERDLHDGAQQRLVGAALALRLLRRPEPDSPLARRLSEIDAALADTLDELRELARGIFPAVLDEEGLAAAVETFAETAPADVTVRRLPNRRYADPVEAAAYYVIAESVNRSKARSAVVAITEWDGRLIVECDIAGAEDDVPLVELEDRVGAVGGSVSVTRDSDLRRVCAELPCG